MKLSSKLARFFACLGMLGLSYAQTTSYTGTSPTSSGLWNANRWSTDSGGPYSSAFTADSDVNFSGGAYTFTGMGTTIDIGNITVSNNSTVTFSGSSGLLSTGGEISTLNVGSGSVLNFNTQEFDATAGTGFIKDGNGVLSLSGGNSGTYSGGFTLNAGTAISRGINAFGQGATNTLTLNGGIIAASASRTFSTAYFGGGIVIGGNVQFGQLQTSQSLASSTAAMSFANDISLGSAARTLTLGNNAAQTFSGVISNTGSGGITFAAQSGLTSTSGLTNGRFEITGTSNTFTGDITITGGQVRFTGDGSLGNSANDVIIDGGAFSTATDTSYVLGAGRTVFVGDGSGSAINTDGIAALTVTNGIVNKSGETGALVKLGTGDLFLLGANNFTGNTSINGGRLVIDATSSLAGGSYAGNISVAASSSFVFNSTASQTLSGAITGAGNFSVDKGTVKLTGSSNSLSGSYAIANGAALDLANNAALNGAASLTLAAGAILDNSSGGAIAIANNSMTKTMTTSLTYRGTGGQNLTLGNGNTTISGSAMTFAINAGKLTIGSDITASGLRITKNGSGTLELSNLGGKLAGTTIINSGTMRIDSNGSLGTGVVFDVKDGASLSLDGSNLTFSKYILSNGSQLLRQGTATINASAEFAANRTLTSADSYTNGQQIIQTGVTISSTADLFGTAPESFVADRIVMDEDSQIRSTGSMILDQNKGISLLATAILSTSQNQSMTINGAISGDGGLTIAAEGAAGAVTLNGMNEYLGATNVTSGTLFVNGELSAGGGAVVVEAGAALGGIGTINRDVTFATGSNFNVSISQPGVTINGTITFGQGFGIANLVGIDWSQISENTYTLISTDQVFSSADIGNFGADNMTYVGYGKHAYFETGSLNLVVVPEPRAALLGGLGLLLILRRRRQA